MFAAGVRAADWQARVDRHFADRDVAAVGVDGALLVPGAGGVGFALLPAAQAGTDPRAAIDCDLLGRTFVAIRRRWFAELGGFDAAFAEGDEIFDLCLRLRERDLRVISDPALAVTEAPTLPRSPERDARRRAFLERWQTRAVPRPNIASDRRGTILRPDGLGGAGRIVVPLPPTTVLDWDAEGQAAAACTESRGEGYVAFVDGASPPPPNWLNRLVDALELESDVVAASLGNTILVAPRQVPQHLRIDPHLPLRAGCDAWLAAAAGMGRTIRGAPARAVTAFQPPAPFASIVMLSWNAPHYTEQAVASIARCTRAPHEVIIIDNGSGPETRARLEQLSGVRVVYNDTNRGFAGGCNQGALLARGTHVVWLNNDVIVTDGWLDALLAVQQRRPTVGISVPVSNNVHGHQQRADAPGDPAGAERYAAERARTQAGRWYLADIAMGLCLCVAREAIDEIGGMDPAYGTGNFEDVDFCIRARGAGYEIAVCEDAYLHHFGSVTFRTNNIDYDGIGQANLSRFVERWGVPTDVPLSTAVLGPIRRGFARARDYVALA